MGIFMAGGVCFHRGRSSAGAEVPLTLEMPREGAAVVRARDRGRRDWVQRAQMKGVRGAAMAAAIGSQTTRVVGSCCNEELRLKVCLVPEACAARALLPLPPLLLSQRVTDALNASAFQFTCIHILNSYSWKQHIVLDWIRLYIGLHRH